MTRILRSACLALPLAAACWLAAPPDAGADDRKLFVGFREIPYVFILFDTSSSMGAVTACTQEDLDAGFCSQLCPDGGCMAPLNADDPASKLYEAKSILYQVLLETENVDFGFATLNQDDLRVRTKHWLYQATTAGPPLPNSSPSITYPAIGQQDVFGRQWPCTSGSDIGCGPRGDAADLADPYEAKRMQRLPRGDIDSTGLLFDSITTFYVAQGNRDYLVRYGIPIGLPGAATITALVTVCESDNSGLCTGTVNSSAVIYTLVDEFLSLDLGPDPNGTQQFEEFDGLEGFFAELDNVDVQADTGETPNGVGRCGGLDMNDDTPDDIYVDPYNLRWPTIPDADTPLLDVGDFIPFDWRDGHKQLILSRLAPNLLLGEAVPDFSISRYFEDPAGTGPNGALELLDSNARPILPTAKTPLDNAIADFREWYDGCRHQPNCANKDNGFEEWAATRDPNWGCRKKYLLIFTDGDISCQEGGNACNATANMRSQLGVESFVIAYGTSSDDTTPGGNQSTLTCLPANSGAVDALFPHNRQELLDALKLIFSAITGRTATFSAAAVPSVQAEALDKLFVTSLSPVTDQSVWPGRLDGFLKPLPLDDENRPDTTPEAACDVPSANESNCHLWNAAEVMIGQVNASDPVGLTPAQRWIAYAQFPADESVPAARETFEESANRSVTIEVERDFWRGLAIQFTPGDSASEDAARAEADGIVATTTALKTGTLPPPEDTEIDYIMGEIFHSDPSVIGSPTNNNYFIGNVGVDADPLNNPDPGYRDFFFTHQKRRKVLAAGSNDGMLHIWDIGAWNTSGPFANRFDNGSGKEILGFMPRSVMPTVKRQTEDLLTPQYAVDGRPAAADVLIDPIHDGTPTPADREWRTVIMGGLREGGATTLAGFSQIEGPLGSEAQKAASYFLLDVTQPDPVNTSDPDFVPDVQDPPACLEAGVSDCGPVPYGTPLWEFTDGILAEREEGDPDDDSDNVIVSVRLDEDDNGFIDLAPTWSTPNLGRMRVCVDLGGGPSCNPAAPGNTVQERYVAVFGGGLDANEATFHDRGNFLYIVDVETGKTLYKHQLDGAAPSEPAAVDTNLDGFLDTIYIGTSYGFLYRADLEQIVGSDTILPQLVDVPVDSVMNDGTVVSETQQRITDAAYSPYLLFNANDALPVDVILGVAGGTLRPQQIYYRPSVIFVPNLDRYALAIGTGNRSDLFDRGEVAGGRFFVFVDDVTATALQDPAFVPIMPPDLEEIGLLDARTTIDYLVTTGGWWYRLAANQRVVTEPFALAGVLFFSSFIPADQAIIVEGDAPGPNPPKPGDDFFCRETGTSQIFASLATNGNGLLYVADEAVRYRSVEDLATRPYTELSQTANPLPDEPPPPLSSDLLKIQEELKDLFPSNCKFPPGYHIGVKTRVTDTGIEFIAPVPICVIEKNFKDY